MKIVSRLSGGWVLASDLGTPLLIRGSERRRPHEIREGHPEYRRLFDDVKMLEESMKTRGETSGEGWIAVVNTAVAMDPGFYRQADPR